MHHPTIGGLLASASSTAAAGPLVRSWLRRRQRFDHPNERSSHTVPTPRGGGLACAVGGTIGALVSRTLDGSPTANWVGSSVVLGSIGRADDVAGLATLPRLGAQVLTGALVGIRVGGPFGTAVGAVAVPSIVNAFNFMDGINGISGGTAAAWGAIVASDPSLSQSARVQGAIAAGMGLGFLPYNVPSASMFLGDIGSYLLGAGIAVTVIESAFTNGRPDPRNAARALAPLAPYLADTGSTIVRRAMRGVAVTEAHREHAYQKLVHETGWPHWAVSVLVASASAASGIAARTRRGFLPVAPIAILYLASPTLARLAGPRVGEPEPTAFKGRS